MSLALTRRGFIAAGAACVLRPDLALSAGPQRIVSLDYGLASTLLSLGIVPKAVASRADWDVWVIEPDLPAEVVDLGSSWEINFEVLTSLRPDLILTTPFNAALTPRLEAVAPTLSLGVFTADGGDVLPKAFAATRALAARVERKDEGDAFIARTEAFFNECRARIARIGAPPLALLSFLDSRHARIYTAPGLYHNVMQRIGLANAWTAPGNFWGFETIGIERLAEMKDPATRLIIFEPVPADVMPKLEESPLWQALPFARPGQFAVLPGALMFGMLNDAMRFARLITDHLEQAA
ncbi:ABC transporter substrate-binding protein [Rhizobium sp. SGZ-381]|uniref:ABC transporter substrate-binding protein n=1 Tax=Rhizobium sp. SGZ-381 TaxID=3342800 RepID=UPI00366A9A1B